MPATILQPRPRHCTKAGTVSVSALLVVLLLFLTLAIPVSAPAQNVGDLSPHPYSNNGVGNPFNPGGAYNINPPAVPGRGPAAPTSPYTWSNVAPKPIGPAVLNRAELFGYPVPSPAPTVTTPATGPYGITLPGNHPLAIGGR